MQRLKKQFKRTDAMLLVGLWGTGVLVAMDVPTYYDVDIRSMEISIEGSKEVLACLKSGCPLQEQYALDDTIQQNLRDLFASVGSTPSKHAGFYMKHQKEVQEYYDNNTTLQETYAKLKKELEAVNSEIKTLREEQKQ
jgi:hypothetical protein